MLEHPLVDASFFCGFFLFCFFAPGTAIPGFGAAPIVSSGAASPRSLAKARMSAAEGPK